MPRPVPPERGTPLPSWQLLPVPDHPVSDEIPPFCLGLQLRLRVQDGQNFKTALILLLCIGSNQSDLCVAIRGSEEVQEKKKLR